MENKNLPFVLRETQFRRFERYIAEAVRKYPEPLNCVVFSEMTTATFVARLRDAKTSYAKYKWQSRTINWDKFNTLKDSLIVAQIDEMVFFGDRTSIETLKRVKIEPEVPIVIDASDTARILNLVDVPLKNFLVMLSHKRLLQPRVKVNGFTQQEVEQYQQQFDVSFDQNPDGSFTLI